MSSLPITESDIRAHTAGGSFERGKNYLEEGALKSLTLDENHNLKAKVQGSDVHPYIVQVAFDGEGVDRVKCTCPYHGGTWCKHAAAALLGALETEDISTPASETVQSLIEPLDRTALVELLRRLVEREPGLKKAIKQERRRLAETNTE